MHSDAIDKAIESIEEDMKGDARGSPEDSIDISDKINRDILYKKYSKKRTYAYISKLETDFKEYRNIIGIKLIHFDRLLSPKYYNFETDEIIVSVECNIDIIVRYLTENKKDFSKHIATKNASYDGFISAMETEFNDYIEEIKKWVRHYQLSQILEFYMADWGEWYDIEFELTEKNQERVHDLIRNIVS